MNFFRHCVVATILASTGCMAIPAASAQEAVTAKPHAFYLVDFEVTDAEGIKPYSATVESTFRPFGGRFVVRGGRVDSLEGAPPKGRLILIEFDSFEQAQAWYHSAAYQAIIPIRHRSGRSQAMIVEAVPAR
jgi:uncharacterized protein (DUF1330 family)